jgi:hypothetical protein
VANDFPSDLYARILILSHFAQEALENPHSYASGHEDTAACGGTPQNGLKGG